VNPPAVNTSLLHCVYHGLKRMLLDYNPGRGLQVCRLDRALQAVELRPTYEDLFQAETGSVEEYLEQMHEMTVVTAIQVIPEHTFLMKGHRGIWLSEAHSTLIEC